MPQKTKTPAAPWDSSYPPSALGAPSPLPLYPTGSNQAGKKSPDAVPKPQWSQSPTWEQSILRIFHTAGPAAYSSHGKVYALHTLFSLTVVW